MLFQFGKHRLIILVLLFLLTLGLPIATAQNSPTKLLIGKDIGSVVWEEKAKEAYRAQQFNEAISFWQKALSVYGEDNVLIRAKIWNNLFLAYQQLGDWENAERAIANSAKILAIATNEDSLVEKDRLLAQTFNNQAILQLALGKEELALNSWEKAETYYAKLGEQIAVLRVRIDRAEALKNLGLYLRAKTILTEVNSSLKDINDPQIKLALWRSLGDIFRIVGDFPAATEIWQQARDLAIINQDEKNLALIWFGLGNTKKAAGELKTALELYEQALSLCRNQDLDIGLDTQVGIELAKLNLLANLDNIEAVIELAPKLKSDLEQLPLNRFTIYNRINFARTLSLLPEKFLSKEQYIEIAQIFLLASKDAKKIGDIRSQTYSLGYLGELYERDRQLEQALSLTKEALSLAQSIKASEIVYLWKWQLARIFKAKGEIERSIAFYSQTVKILNTIERDALASAPEIQFSFQNSVEPVYRELVSLLLGEDDEHEVSQEKLVRARNVIESLKVAELDNFFREACLQAKLTTIDRLDEKAAVIYPIILKDRLETIVTLPNNTFKHYTSKIGKKELNDLIVNLQKTLVIRSKRDFYAPAQKLYQLILEPAEKDLHNSRIKTLIFVLDGALRNLPMGALYDGQHFAIENYSIAIAPSLQLLSPQPLKQISPKILAAGITQERNGFTALDFVDDELKAIDRQLPTLMLLDKQFTAKSLQEQIELSDYPIVHIATHGQFSSNLKDTFLLLWDSRLNINELYKILQSRNTNEFAPIELLVLSACETAIGDDRASLGLAGMAVKAGARSTLATLWSVNDIASAEFMEQFYQELTQNPLNKAEVVRQAQISLLNNSAYKHPFYWAPYVLIGNWL
jgi:CHAT domain-containing protein